MIREKLSVNRFGLKIRCARFEGLFDRPNIIERGHHEHRCRVDFGTLPDFRADTKAIGARHHDIEYDEIRCQRRTFVDPVVAIFGFLTFETKGLKGPTQQYSLDWVIVDKQYQWGLIR